MNISPKSNILDNFKSGILAFNNNKGPNISFNPCL